jgi:cysteine desulfurase
VTPIYLDHNSTTPLLPEVADAMLEVAGAGYVNPASQHQSGQRARRLLEETREAILSLLGGKTSGMDADRLLFTSGGTEANNFVLRGLAGSPPGRVIVSSLEHPSILGPAEYLATHGAQVDRIRALTDGSIDLAHFEQLLCAGPSPRIVSVMAANNETGKCQPIATLAQACHARGIPFHTDAVQLIGKADGIWNQSPGISAMTVAAHKFHGPVGIGALVLRSLVKPEPLLFGGFQQEGLRPGTESLILAVGMRKALELAIAGAEDRQRHLRTLRDTFVAELTSQLPEIVIAATDSPTGRVLPNTVNIAFVGLDRQELLLALDMAGVCCSTGSACASGSSEPSPVLVAMGLPEAVIRGALRFSFGITNTAAEASEAARRILKVVNDLRSRKSRSNPALTPRQGAEKSLQ